MEKSLLTEHIETPNYLVFAQTRNQPSRFVKEMMALGGANLLDLLTGSKWAQERTFQWDSAMVQIFGPKVNNSQE